MDLKSIKERTVVCFSVSAKSQNRLDIMLKWLSELKTKKWKLYKFICFCLIKINKIFMLITKH